LKYVVRVTASLLEDCVTLGNRKRRTEVIEGLPEGCRMISVNGNPIIRNGVIVFVFKDAKIDNGSTDTTVTFRASEGDTFELPAEEPKPPIGRLTFLRKPLDIEDE